jgi:hypothetical protein
VGELRGRLDLDMKKVYLEFMEGYGSILQLIQTDEERKLEFELNDLASKEKRDGNEGENYIGGALGDRLHISLNQPRPILFVFLE